MAETFRSPDVSAREIDLSGPTSIEPVGIPPGIISPTEKGTAFVPTTLANINDYVVKFGEPSSNFKFGPLCANEWLTYHQSLLQVRVLGVGTGEARTTSGINGGKVTSAGMVVGSQQPQSSLSGATGNNSYAVTSGSAGGYGTLGRTYFLAACMSQSMSSTFLSNAGLGDTHVVVRGMLLAASGVVPMLSASNTDSDLGVTATQGAQAGFLKGAHTGSVSLQNGKQEFTILLNGHKGSATYPRVITGSFDMTAPNYFVDIMNKDSLMLEQAGYVLYSWFDIHPAMAVVTGSGFIPAVSGAGNEGAGFEKIAFLTTSSFGRDVGSSTIPNFECFEDRFKTASTPWIQSQRFGGASENLFKVWLLNDGTSATTKYKFSIENIAPSTTDTYLYGTFDLVVRDLNDSDSNKVVIEQWRGINLDPKSPRFIGKIIGDYKTFYNFDAIEGKQRLITEGDYPNRSSFIRVELAEQVKTGEINAVSLPVGFRGNQHLVTSGSAVFGAITDTAYLAADTMRQMVQPPVPMRLSLTKGTSTAQTVDKNLYWGIQFEHITSALDPNVSQRPNGSLQSYSKYYPNFQLTWQNVVVSGNEGVSDTAANGILDADRFNNNAFSLEKIKVRYNTTTGLADTTYLSSWTYERSGSIVQDTTAYTRAMAVSDLVDPSVRQVAKFSFIAEGGWDGTNIFNEDASKFTDNAVNEEINNSSRGLSKGPTIQSYIKALDILKDTSEVDIQLLLVPGIRNSYVTDIATQTAENRFDALYLMDIEERDVNNQRVTSSTQRTSVKNTVTNFRTRGLNSSFAAAYFPDVVMRDGFNRTNVQVPPSVVVLGAFAKNDSVGHPWFAPAGFARGSLSTTDSVTLGLSKENRDDLYSVGVNPIMSFPNEGIVVWGQKTLLARQSAFDRINVRRLLIAIRREVRKVSNRIIFLQNREETLSLFRQLVNPVLKRVQTLKGVEGYKVEIDSTTTTQADIENKTIKGKIWIAPRKSLEFMSLDFVINNAGASLS